MINYKCIDQQTFSDGEYKLIPIRFEDRYDIMKWRNEQMYHLRQTTLLTIEQQDEYFSNVIAPLFDKDHPEQLLFSFFKKDELIGYGGLVHIHWEHRNAEVSFLTKNEKCSQMQVFSTHLHQLQNSLTQDQTSYHHLPTLHLRS